MADIVGVVPGFPRHLGIGPAGHIGFSPPHPSLDPPQCRPQERERLPPADALDDSTEQGLAAAKALSVPTPKCRPLGGGEPVLVKRVCNLVCRITQPGVLPIDQYRAGRQRMFPEAMSPCSNASGPPLAKPGMSRAPSQLFCTELAAFLSAPWTSAGRGW